MGVESSHIFFETSLEHGLLQFISFIKGGEGGARGNFRLYGATLLGTSGLLRRRIFFSPIDLILGCGTDMSNARSIDISLGVFCFVGVFRPIFFGVLCLLGNCGGFAR